METALYFARWAASLFVVLSLAGLVLTASLAMIQRLQARREIARARRGDGGAPVSVVIPVKAMEAEFVAAQQSVFDQDYGDFDVTITAAEAQSPAIAAARVVLAAHPDRAGRIVRSTASFAVSPKVNNLCQAVEDAAHDIIFMKDSNIILPPESMRAAVARLTPDVGMVVAVPQAHGALTFAAEIEASIMNQSHGRILAAAAALGLGFGVGKLMVFRRSDLRRAGGFAAVAHSVGEDSALAHKFGEMGLKTKFMGPPIIQILGARNFRDVFHRQQRWTVIRRYNEPLAFLIEPFGLASCAALAAAFAAPLWGLFPLVGALGALCLWFVVETALALARGWDVSRSAPAAMIARDAMMLSVWLSAWFTRRVVWAAAVYEANREGEAKPCPPAEAAKGRDI